MNKFEIGDLVRCINVKGLINPKITLNKTYIVQELWDLDGDGIYIITDNNQLEVYFYQRFTKVNKLYTKLKLIKQVLHLR